MPAREPSAAAQSLDRVHAFDVLRVICVLCIVWFHTNGPGSAWLVWRLPVLMMISIALVTIRPSAAPMRTLAHRRARRLLLPWIVWSGVYLAFKVGVQLVNHATLWGLVTPSVLLVGTEYHLWYLPFAFVATLAVNATLRASPHFAPRRWRDASDVGYLAACAAAAAVLVGAPMIYRFSLHHPPMGQWVASLPAIPFGVAIGLAARPRSVRTRAARLAGASAIAAAVTYLVTRAGHDPSSLDGRYAIAVPVLCIGLLTIRHVPKAVAAFGRLALGIYLCHVLMHQLLLHLRITHVGSATHSAGVILLSVLTSWGLSRSPLRKIV